MRATLVACAIVLSGMALGGAVDAAEVLSVPINKARILKLTGPATVVSVGNPEIADATVDSSRLVIVTGRAVGETNLLILDAQGNEIAGYDVVVVAGDDRTITIHRGADAVSTLSCDPRCAGVANPGLDASAGPKGIAPAPK